MGGVAVARSCDGGITVEGVERTDVSVSATKS